MTRGFYPIKIVALHTRSEGFQGCLRCQGFQGVQEVREPLNPWKVPAMLPGPAAPGLLALFALETSAALRRADG